MGVAINQQYLDLCLELLILELEEKLYIRRLTEISTVGFVFSFGLQKWIADYIDENEEFRNELKIIKKKSNSYPF